MNIKGDLFKNLIFNNDEYYNYQKNWNDYSHLKAVKNPLPSDLRFREDLIWLFYGNEKFA